MRLRVVVAEDSLLVREGVRRVLESQPDLEVVALCANLPELLAAGEEHRPAVVGNDRRMPPTSTDEGIPAAKPPPRGRPRAGGGGENHHSALCGRGGRRAERDVNRRVRAVLLYLAEQ